MNAPVWLASAATHIELPASRAGATLGSKLRAGWKRMQYARMVALLDRLPDTHLRRAGLHRRDIPEHARKAVYGDD